MATTIMTAEELLKYGKQIILFSESKRKNKKVFCRRRTYFSTMNQLLLLYQRSEASETNEVHDWIREVRSLKEEATPIFLFGENAHKLNSDTGEIIEEKRLSLKDHEQLTKIKQAQLNYF